MITVAEVVTDKQLSTFIDFPHALYEGDEYYVPEIFMGQKDMFNPKKYPFHKYGKARYFLAYKDDKVVGRIAAINNPNYNTHFNTKVGFWGFMDMIQDQNVCNALLDKVKEFAISNGCDSIMGPTNFTTNETAGVLVEGFDNPPKIMMTYNKPYYKDLLEQYGLRKEMDLYAYMIYTDKVSEKSIALSKSIEERLTKKGITIRNINLKDINNETEKVKQIYNHAWEENWGFVPFTDAEFEYLKNDLKMILDPKFAYIAEKDGKPIGFSLTLPNINEILIKNKKGRLFPFGLFRLLLGKNKTKTVRIMAMGVIEEFRKIGIEAVFFAKTIQEAKARKLVGGEASWVLENNIPMRKSAEHLNGEKYKTYRLYKMPILGN
ncbi:MAG: hypothetical protein R2774_12215 [Saprospiraceae bacterium]